VGVRGARNVCGYLLADMRAGVHPYPDLSLPHCDLSVPYQHVCLPPDRCARHLCGTHVCWRDVLGHLRPHVRNVSHPLRPADMRLSNPGAGHLLDLWRGYVPNLPRPGHLSDLRWPGHVRDLQNLWWPGHV
jgi:hypothetical protein